VRVFACEFVTGGGFVGRPIPPALGREAELMVRALAADLLALPDVEVLLARDPRLPLVAGAEHLVPQPGEDFAALYQRGLDACDAAWPTAPESGGALEALARLTRESGRILLGSSPEAIGIAASKHRTIGALSAAGIRTPPTARAPEEVEPLPGPWVVKPDDGAGAEGVEVVSGWAAARRRLAEALVPTVAEPWLTGDPCSLSLLCASGGALVLSVNRQHIAVREGKVSLAGITVNARATGESPLEGLGAAVPAAVPGLWGYVGVDFIRTPEGPVVIEVNPRVTTSCAGLVRARGISLAALVLEMARSGRLPDRADPNRDRPVEIHLEPGDD
jgi:predicted ATP-grasp superfamily ATP-dependent carboligase